MKKPQKAMKAWRGRFHSSWVSSVSILFLLALGTLLPSQLTLAMSTPLLQAWHRSPEPRRAPATSFDNQIDQAARENGLDPLLIKAIISVESRFNPSCVSHRGARGLMQLMPVTARGLGVQNVFDPQENIRAGTRHLRYLLNQFSGNLTLSLAAYNAGQSPVARHQGIPPFPETQRYVQRVLETYNSYRS